MKMRFICELIFIEITLVFTRKALHKEATGQQATQRWPILNYSHFTSCCDKLVQS